MRPKKRSGIVITSIGLGILLAFLIPPYLVVVIFGFALVVYGLSCGCRK